MHHISIDVVSDVVCPWCYLGKARLDQALAALSGEVIVTVSWRPYQLNPDLPPEGVDHKAHLAAKLGGQAAVDQAHARLEELGRADGIAFNFDAVRISPNTLDAHRLVRWAGTEGAAIQDAVVTALFKANFEEGRNLGDRAELVAIAGEAGMQASVVEALFDSGADREAVLEEIEMARNMGVTGVPCFIIDNQYAVMGAQTVEAMTAALRDITQMKMPN
ncbi:disulfide bond formation protein DsbA [Xaviernesmea oryzae]|uniref:Disulfide bond formation protein DsbA n=1 Tax=Xaviernesmea oryzae TaxID=464029 RepID=A0A1Q9AWK7_9HYPH|nr:DsbA family oxidoreductase [Xaviernesmea oryzae]OLP59836.1 disulfide bond formation protein DsbA [Xaviernesmea oryzae]SEK49733.1 Predicted dithiol-disulfide isomerase, DsbA family [Xaviernesmea oryzae]